MDIAEAKAIDPEVKRQVRNLTLPAGGRLDLTYAADNPLAQREADLLAGLRGAWGEVVAVHQRAMHGAQLELDKAALAGVDTEVKIGIAIPPAASIGTVLRGIGAATAGMALYNVSADGEKLAGVTTATTTIGAGLILVAVAFLAWRFLQ